MKINYDKKTVECSQKLVDWRNSFRDASNGVSEMLYKVARMGWGHHLSDWQGNEYSDFYENEGLDLDNSLAIKKVLLKAIMDDFEFKLEESKHFYWRKKEGYLAYFEDIHVNYLNVDYENTITLASKLEIPGYKTKFTKSEARRLLKDDFYKFEKVEVDR